MQKKKIVFAVACTILIIVIVLGLFFGWFFSPGMHIFWKFANFNFENHSCYIIDFGTGAVVGRTEMTLKGFENGFTNVADYKSWVFEVPGYTGILPDTDLAAGCHDGEWGVVFVEYIDDDGNLLPDVDGKEELLGNIKFVNSVPVVFIHYSEDLERRDVYAVCADSETEALQIYRQYLEKK